MGIVSCECQSTIVEHDDKILADLTDYDQEFIVARGGGGGFGNAHFKVVDQTSAARGLVGERVVPGGISSQIISRRRFSRLPKCWKINFFVGC